MAEINEDMQLTEEVGETAPVAEVDETFTNAQDELYITNDEASDATVICDDTPEKRKKVAHAYSVIHIALFVYMMISQSVATFLTVGSLIGILLTGKEILSISTDFLLMINAVSQYVLAFPVFCYMTRNIKSEPREIKEKLSAGKFFVFFLVAEGVMMFGALLTTALSKIFKLLIGISEENIVETVTADSNILITFICVCVFAPIFEELIFRKLMLDKLAPFGRTVALCFSAVSFGFFHGNFTQMLYAMLVGFVLGYLYLETGKVKYTIWIHAILNFVGGVLPMGVEWLANESARLRNLAAEGEAIDYVKLLICELLAASYSVIMVLFIIVAAIILFFMFYKKRVKIEKNAEYGTRMVLKSGGLSVGVLLFFISSFILAISSLLAI